MAFVVYRLHTFPSQGNSHQIGYRNETWSLHVDRAFDTEALAKAYVRSRSRAHTTLPNLLFDLTEDPRSRHRRPVDLVEDFCFGQAYWLQRRYFLGMPDLVSMREALVQAGVHLV